MFGVVAVSVWGREWLKDGTCAKRNRRFSSRLKAGYGAVIAMRTRWSFLVLTLKLKRHLR